MSRPGVFLDRDGTLNVEISFLRKPDELELIPGAAGAVRRLNDLGLPTCVISNQSGVARGYLTEEDLIPIHERLAEALAAEGAHLDRIYYCPHHPTEGFAPYNIECECRKPATGMLDKAVRELDLDPAASYVVGDRVADVLAGRNIGAMAILVLTGYGETAAEECRAQGIVPDRIVPDIVAAVDVITEHYRGRTRNA